MSSNPSDLNELLRQLLMQQQQQQRPQQRQQQQQPRLEQAQPAAPPPFQQCNNGPDLPLNSGPPNQLENLVAQYLNGSQGTTGTGATQSPAVLASFLHMGNNRHQPALTPLSPSQAAPALNGNNPSQQNQKLLALSNLLSSINQNPVPQTEKFSVAQTQQRQPQLQTGLNQQHHMSTFPQQHQLQQPQQIGMAQIPPQQRLQHQNQGPNQSSHIEQGKRLSLSTSTNATAKSSPRLSVESSANDRINQCQPSQAHTSSDSKTGQVTMPPEPVPVSVLQSWNLVQLESHAKRLEKYNKPVPKIVEILIDDARQQEEKRLAKRLSNRRSATASRARKRQLAEVLASDNARLRRPAAILNYLPDSIIVVGLDGKILFCNTQLQRVLNHRLEDLEGSLIKDLLVPESRGTFRRLIQDLETAECLAAEREEGIDSGSDSNENGGQNNSDGSSNNAVVSRSSDQSFNVLEVNVNEQDKNANGDNTSDSSGDPSKKKVSFGKASGTAENEAPPAKKSENILPSNSDSTSGATGMDIDDVMGDSVTANNAGAKLSSLMHCPNVKASKECERNLPTRGSGQQENEPHIHRKHTLAPRAVAQKQDSQSSSSTDSDQRPRAGINSSEDSGYMDSNSNGSSDEYGEDSSTSGNSIKRKVKRPRPLAPACLVSLICNDLTTIVCELTASIRTRTPNDEDIELGIVDLNPKPTPNFQENQLAEKEVLLCFRPILQGKKVGEEFRFPIQVSDTSNVNASEEST